MKINGGMTKKEKEYLQMIEAGIQPGKRAYNKLFKAAAEGRLEFDDSTPRIKRIAENTRKFVASHRIKKTISQNGKTK